MKNAFYFTLKAFLFSSYFNSLKSCDFLVIWKVGLIRKIRLVLKFMTSQLGRKQLQYIYCPISQEGNWTMKFGQSVSGGNGWEAGQLRFKDFWAQTLAWVEKYTYLRMDCDVRCHSYQKGWFIFLSVFISFLQSS